MNELEKTLEYHLDIIKKRLADIPKSNNHSGILSGIQNNLDSTIKYGEDGQKIVDEIFDKMLDHINSNLISNHSQEEIENFKVLSKEKISEILQNGVRDSWK